MLAEPDRAIETIRAALGAGCEHIDTSNVSAPSWDERGHNERLIAEALAGYVGDLSNLVVATKGGLLAGPDGIRRDGSAGSASTLEPRGCNEGRTARRT